MFHCPIMVKLSRYRHGCQTSLLTRWSWVSFEVARKENTNVHLSQQTVCQEIRYVHVKAVGVILRTQRVLIVYNNMRASTVCPTGISVARALLHHGRSHHGRSHHGRSHHGMCDQMVDDGESHQLVVRRVMQQTFSVNMTADLTLCPLPVSNSY